MRPVSTTNSIFVGLLKIRRLWRPPTLGSLLVSHSNKKNVYSLPGRIPGLVFCSPLFYFVFEAQTKLR